MARVPKPLSRTKLQAARLDVEPYRLASGVRLDHVYESRFGSDSVNPGKGSGRFHPFNDASGTTVPVYYAATSIQGSFTETLFRSSGAMPCRHVPANRLSAFSHAEITFNRAVALAHLSGDFLARLGLTRAALLETGPSTYAGTALWAGAIHDAYPELRGLAWVSRQHDATTCVLLFGDRVDASDITVVASTALQSAKGMVLTDRVAMRLGIVVVR